MFDGKTILITGGTGSFGSAFVPWVLKQPIRKLIVYSRDEYKQWCMAKSIKDSRVRFFLGDIRDLKRLTHAMATVDICIHAAALKHVTALEYNPQEAYRTNIQGTQNVIDAVVDSPCWQAVLLSTDKACEPANLYGATKMVAEKLWIASNVHKPVFSFVRYGNVMESRGGVLSVWRDALDAGKDHLEITDTRMTRFWMTYPMALGAVSLALGNPAGLGVIGKAKPFSLISLAWTLAAKYQRKVEVNEIGRQTGEKLHETLVTEFEGERCLDAGSAYVLPPLPAFNELVVYPGWPVVPTGFSYQSCQGEGMTPEEIGAML
jgi:UDP-N-acetylglucosamine 4,6-dehydratase